MSVAVLLVWLGVQPWLQWPDLSQEASHRLTLVCCCVILGLVRFVESSSAPRPLPRSLGWWVGGLLLVMTSHHWHLIRNGTYFEFFQETALFADGILVVVALTWGLWALWQLPATWFGWVPWMGVGLVSLNCVLAFAQSRGLPWHLGTLHPVIDVSPAYGTLHHLSPYKACGFMGVDYSLGAYGVAWLPILWALKWPLAILPLVCVAFANKTTAWLGVAVVAWWMLPGKWRMVGVGLAVAAAYWWSGGDLAKRVVMRGETWWHAAQAIWTYRWRGVGFHPMTSTIIRQQFGYALPGLHSDWLSLAFHAGAIIATWAGGLMAAIGWATPRTTMAKALQASLVALAVMSLGQSVVSRASLTSLTLVFLVWWWHEQRQEVSV